MNSFNPGDRLVIDGQIATFSRFINKTKKWRIIFENEEIDENHLPKNVKPDSKKKISFKTTKKNKQYKYSGVIKFTEEQWIHLLEYQKVNEDNMAQGLRPIMKFFQNSKKYDWIVIQGGYRNGIPLGIPQDIGTMKYFAKNTANHRLHGVFGVGNSRKQIAEAIQTAPKIPVIYFGGHGNIKGEMIIDGETRLDLLFFLDLHQFENMIIFHNGCSSGKWITHRFLKKKNVPILTIVAAGELRETLVMEHKGSFSQNGRFCSILLNFQRPQNCSICVNYAKKKKTNWKKMTKNLGKCCCFSQPIAYVSGALYEYQEKENWFVKLAEQI